MDAFFNKGFKAAKCKTLLKLTIPRIKLLRNRREIQIKQMRRDIAKLLETGQEATARIRVEHIIREENMMAAQEILELYCELISVRLPIIETQRECPLDLKEAISTVCFAAPRCADLPELLQVQMSFVSKYGKEFVSAATELRPDCGVNRQIIELLSVRAPAPEVKLKLLKEIAEEHELDWDPSPSETEFFKQPEDLLNGPTQFVSGSQLPLPKEKHEESLNSIPDQDSNEQSDSDSDTLDFPEVPKASLRPSANQASAPAIVPPVSATLHHEADDGSSENIDLPHEPDWEPKEVDGIIAASTRESPTVQISQAENKQFVPFISPPSLSSPSFTARPSNPSPSMPRTSSDTNVDLQDVLAAAQAAADSAERAAAAARSAASLAQLRISELVNKKNSDVSESMTENPFHQELFNESAVTEKQHFDHQDSSRLSSTSHSQNIIGDPVIHPVSESNFPSIETTNTRYDSTFQNDHVVHQPQRLASMDDDPYFSYPNLFKSQGSDHEPGIHSSTGNSS